jgi:hypothetical protein
MRPKSALYFVDKMNDSWYFEKCPTLFKTISKLAWLFFFSDEFVDFIRRERNSETLTIDNFLPMAHKFGLELTTMIAVDTKLGCFNKDLPEGIIK